MSEQPSSKDDVRRGLGILPNKRICQNREPVQVYTACQFVKGQNMALIYFQLGNNSTMPPVANSSTSRNTLFPYLNLCPTWVQVKLRVLTIGPVPKLGTSQRAGTVPLANLARSYFYSRRVVGKLYGNFRPTWSKEIYLPNCFGPNMFFLYLAHWNNSCKLVAILSSKPCASSLNLERVV